MSMRSSLPLASVLLLFVACRGAAPEPVPLAVGTDTCAQCNTVIGDPHFAGQFRAANGDVRKFDDPLCLFRALRAAPAPPTAIYFHDRTADAWLPAAETWLATTPKTASPQGSGWAAYPDFGAAQDAVASDGGGEILAFAQAAQRLPPD